MLSLGILPVSNVFSVKSCYNILNDGGCRSMYKKSIWKSAAPLKVNIFAWLVCHDKIISKDNLQKRSWTGSLQCNICNYLVESTLHIFLHCTASTVISSFFVSRALELINCAKISYIFSFHHALNFKFSYQCWNSLVLAIIWTLWLNRNALIFRHFGLNINSIFHQILLLFLYWTDILTAGQDNLSHTLNQVKQDWDQAHPVQDFPSMAPVSGTGRAQVDSLGPSTSVAISGLANPVV